MAAEGIYLKRCCPIILLLVAVFLGDAYALQHSIAENGSNAKSLHSILTGRGVNIGFIASGNVLETHQAFIEPNGLKHAVNHDVSGLGFYYNFHDTPFAGIIISRGDANHPSDIGVAPDAFVHCVRMTSSDKTKYIETLNELVNQNCKVIVTGLAFSYDPNNPNLAVRPDGNSDYSKIYDYYAEQYNIVFANAAGNYVKDDNGNILFYNITIFGDAYNGITTGGLAELPTNNYIQTGLVSCRGYTLDGRRKPDITAPSTYQIAPGYSSTSNAYWNSGYGDGATSWSVPHTAGIAALLLQYANSTAEPNDGKNVVIKAVIVNSTFPNIRNKTGGYTNPAVNVWEASRGFGGIDALAAYETLSAGKISKSVATSAVKGWAYDSIEENQTHTYLISAQKSERLVLTITWNRKIDRKNGSYDVNLPKFNIDLIIKDPYDVNVYAETDTLNNLIKVDLPLTSTGQYKVMLTNTTTKTRSYALAFERLETLTGDFNSDFAVNYKDLKQLATDWLATGAGLVSDIVPDANVNNLDYCKFADSWMDIDSRYYTP